MTSQLSGQVAVVTDSTAYLPAEQIDRYGIHVVPMHVVMGGVSRREGVEVTPSDVARALGERRVDVTTSRPTPGEFADLYGELLERGASGVVSIHVSQKLSGTVEAAEVAAERYPGKVVVVDSRSTGMGLGFPVLAAARAAIDGQPMAAVLAAVEQAITDTTCLFYVDTLEFLRRGGRIGAAAALLGTALSVKPILHVSKGEVVVKERVRTAGRALARLEELSVSAAGSGGASVAVHHLAAPERAETLAEHLRARIPDLREIYISELGAAVGAHVGPGALAAVVCRASGEVVDA